MAQKRLIEDLFEKKSKSFPDFGIESMIEALPRLKNPHIHVPAVHVAGTNGKGSVCTKIAKAFELDGCRVGLYTSPHIDSYTERIQINSSPIAEDDFLRHLQYLYKVCGTDFSFFEAMTLVSFLYFRENNVDVAVIETGLGGRKDATTLCCPILSVITSISLDHTELLGDTVEAIAREKAGIIKKGVQVVIGPHVPYNVIHEYAERNNAPLCQVQGEFSDFDQENSQIALQSLSFLSVSDSSSVAAVAVRPQCRFERILRKVDGESPVQVVLDVAHNPDGIARLMQYVDNVFPRTPCVVLFGVCKDKLYESMLKMLPEDFVLVCTQAASERALPAESLAIAAKKAGVYKIYVEKELDKAVSRALCIASTLQAPLIVTGTFYMMGPIRRLLGAT